MGLAINSNHFEVVGKLCAKGAELAGDNGIEVLEAMLDESGYTDNNVVDITKVEVYHSEIRQEKPYHLVVDFMFEDEFDAGSGSVFIKLEDGKFAVGF